MQLMISDLSVEVDFYYGKMQQRAEIFYIKKYKSIDQKSDLVIEPSAVSELMRKYNWLDDAQREVVSSAQLFFLKALKYKRILVHASVVAIDRDAYLFVAPGSGGKSSHVSMWKELFGNSITILADDSPIVGMKDSKPVVWNTPWSKKTESVDTSAYFLKGICLLEKGHINVIEKITAEEALESIMCMYPPDLDKYAIQVCINDILLNVPAWRLSCTVSIEAAEIAAKNLIKAEGYHDL